MIRKGNCYEKRVCALIIAAVIPIALLFTGCADVSEVEVTSVGFSPEGGQLTVAEYRDALSDAFKEYAVALNTVPLEEDNYTPEALSADRKNSRKSCRQALNKSGTMNPPEEFAEKHIKLLDGVNKPSHGKNARRYVCRAVERGQGGDGSGQGKRLIIKVIS